VIQRLFGMNWTWKTGFTVCLVGNYFNEHRERLYTESAIDYMYSVRIWKLLTFQDMSDQHWRTK
jgi:hypothetical protein